MRVDAMPLEEARLINVSSMEDYPSMHERHRIFPEVFKGKNHRKILDIAAGVGVVSKRIRDGYDAEVLCNDICPKCLAVMGLAGLNTVSFDIDNVSQPYPVKNGQFDAVVALATIEHLINIEYFLDEINRILQTNGRLYLSAPNYSGLTYLLPFLVTGKTFHDPVSEAERYEFYAHVRYFTYRSLVDIVHQHGFTAEAVYLPVPESSAKFLAIKQKSKLKAQLARGAMKTLYHLFSPRWAAEPVICFRKGRVTPGERIKKIIL